VLILKADKVLCFDTLLEVLILKELVDGGGEGKKRKSPKAKKDIFGLNDVTPLGHL